MAHQSGARHCADVAGTFAGEEWAPRVERLPKPEPEVKPPADANPLVRRLDAASLASVAEFLGITVLELIDRYSE